MCKRCLDWSVDGAHVVCGNCDALGPTATTRLAAIEGAISAGFCKPTRGFFLHRGEHWYCPRCVESLEVQETFW